MANGIHRFIPPWAALAAVLVVVAFAVASARADESWTRFRGPNGSGVSEDAISVKWSDADYAWKTELPGQGHSSPVVWKDCVFVTAADEDAGERMLLCVNAADGTILWRHAITFEPFRKHGENSYASSTPAVDDRCVYAQWTSPDAFVVVAVTHDGAEAWRADLGPYRTQHGGGGSPILVGGSVIVMVDQDKSGSFIAALDHETGAVVWKTPRDSTKFSTSTPCVYRSTDGPEQIVFTTNANGFTALDPASGKILWELPGVFHNRVVSSPVVAGGLVLGGCGEGARGDNVVAVKPPAAASDVPEMAYELTQETPYVPTPLVFRDRLFTWSDSGTVACHDAATGAQRWAGQTRGGFFGSPVCAGGNLYCVSKRGEVVVVSATSDAFEELARNPLDEPSDATPAIADGRMYVRTLSHLICVRGTGDARPAAAGRTEP